MMFLSGLLKGFWKYAAVAFAAVAGVVGIYLKGRREGAASEKAEQTEKIHEKVEDAERVRRDARDPGERKRVRRFYRDG